MRSDSPASESCRACGGGVSKAFEVRLLGRYDVSYFRCESCHSLQTEYPYWLSEAYEAAISVTDTGAVARNLSAHAAISNVARVLRASGRFIDFGGGAGMLCRLLRDSGFDAYMYDRYTEPIYAKAFAIDADELSRGGVGLLSAIEVFEHCEQPAGDVGRLFEIKPDVLVATTLPYRGEGSDWWYLSPQTGQHIFLYSPECLERLGRQRGYSYLGVGEFHIWSRRPLASWRRVLLKALLSRLGLRLTRVWIAAMQRGRHADADNAMLCRRLSQQQRPPSTR